MADLTFGQAQGFEAIPSQAQLGTVSQETVAQLWHVVHNWLNFGAEYDLEAEKKRIMQQWWVTQKHRMIDECPAYIGDWIAESKAEMQASFPAPYNFVQFLIGKPPFVSIAGPSVTYALEDTRAAYRVVAGKIVPYASEQEHEQLVVAVETADQAGAPGAKSHLLNAASAMTAGEWSRAVQECMAAVEGAARVATGEHGKDLGGILVLLRKSGRIKHPALADALTKLYAYTSDEKGVRHSLVLQESSDVTEADAFLMLGLCASFVTFVLKLPSA